MPVCGSSFYSVGGRIMSASGLADIGLCSGNVPHMSPIRRRVDTGDCIAKSPTESEESHALAIIELCVPDRNTHPDLEPEKCPLMNSKSAFDRVSPSRV